jgi:SSS family solute:Na+ symporter
MTPTSERTLGIISLTTLLVSAHYGLGFILGTAEKSVTNGASGSLYAVAVGVGMIALALLAPFYWTRIEPIWTLMGDRYGTPVKVGIGIMSWTSLIGIEAVQIIAAAAILGLVGLPDTPIMVGLAVTFAVLALLPVERASWVFRALLLLNILVLAGTVWRLDGGGAYWQEAIEFLPSVTQMGIAPFLSVMLTTVLLVLIDMKCQQFVVRSQTVAIARWSCVLAGLILILFSFLPAAVILAAQKAAILPDAISSKAAIPYILSWVGGGLQAPLGIAGVATLALPALGLGSNVLRIQTRTSLDVTGVNPTFLNRCLFTGFNALMALGIALKGGEIVGLILSFYAAYLSAVWVPFIAYLVEQGTTVNVSVTSVRFALVMGGIAAIASLGLALFYPDAIWFGSSELTILLMGATFSSLGLLVIQGIERFLLPRLSLQKNAE